MKILLITTLGGHNRKCGYECLQFQQRQTGIGVKELFLALLRDIFLECGRRLGIVSVEAVEDFLNVRRPLLALVKGLRHLGTRVGAFCDFSAQ